MRLYEACHALVALLYPFRYSHVYIPILPASLLEVDIVLVDRLTPKIENGG